jgi:type I restriction enzyme S subunit
MVDEYRSSGVPFLRSQNVLPHRIDLSDIKFIDGNFHSKLKKSALRPGDVVTVRTGKPGTTSVVPVSLVEANCSDLVITRPGPALDSQWLSYYINEAASDYVSAHLVGAVQQHFNVGAAKSLVLHLPPLQEQQAIAEVLGALDDKISANTSLTEAADELSRVVFTSMLNNTTSRALSDVADFVNGKAFTKDASGTGRVVIRIAELNSGLGGSTVYNDIEVVDQYLARPGDLLFAWSGSLTLHRWFRAEGIINQHIFKVIPKDGYPTWCVNGLLARKLDEFKGIAADKATTMGHIQRRHLDEPVEVPVGWQIERNDGVMTSLWQRALAAEEESLGLMTMRDALLPQLMAGKIRVRDAEQMVRDVV